MKSYSVKSNAKRFARGIAAKYPAYEAAEPVLVSPSMDAAEREWFPVVNRFISSDPHPDEVLATCVVIELPADGVSVSFAGPAPDEAEADGIDDDGLKPYQREIIESIAGGSDRVVIGYARTEPLPNSDIIWESTPDASGLKAMFDAVEPAGDIDAVEPTIPAPVIGVPDSLAAMAASLPPRVESSRSEIDARRAERRARIDAEKAAGKRTASGDKVKGISKKKKILDLIARPNGATQAELEAATGWQRHTLRGYIAGTLRKTLAPVGIIECRKGRTADDAKETRYVFVRHAATA